MSLEKNTKIYFFHTDCGGVFHSHNKDYQKIRQTMPYYTYTARLYVAGVDKNITDLDTFKNYHPFINSNAYTLNEDGKYIKCSDEHLKENIVTKENIYYCYKNKQYIKNRDNYGSPYIRDVAHNIVKCDDYYYVKNTGLKRNKDSNDDEDQEDTIQFVVDNNKKQKRDLKINKYDYANYMELKNKKLSKVLDILLGTDTYKYFHGNYYDSPRFCEYGCRKVAIGLDSNANKHTIIKEFNKHKESIRNLDSDILFLGSHLDIACLYAKKVIENHGTLGNAIIDESNVIPQKIHIYWYDGNYIHVIIETKKRYYKVYYSY